MLVSKKHVDEKLAKACVLYAKIDDTNSDKLYKDAECTQMVTFSEFKEFMFLGLVIFVHNELDAEEYYAWPWRVEIWGDDRDGYGMVSTLDYSSGLTCRYFYTAEYEPDGE